MSNPFNQFGNQYVNQQNYGMYQPQNSRQMANNMYDMYRDFNQNQMMQPQQQSQYQYPQQEVLKINGRNGANTLSLAPNSSLLALDMMAPLVWLIQTDGAGYKQITPYDISPHNENNNQVDMPSIVQTFDERISNLERMVLNDKSDSQSTTKRTKSKSKSNGSNGSTQSNSVDDADNEPVV